MKLKTLMKVFQDLKGSTLLGLDTETVVDLRGGKQNKMRGRVTKRMTGAVVMAFSNANHNSYETMMRNALEKSGVDGSTFKLQPRPWGERWPDLPIVEHNDQYYLEVVFVQPGKVEYFLDGEPIDKDDIEGLKPSSPQQLVTIRTFGIDSIKAIRTGGKEYL